MKSALANFQTLPPKDAARQLLAKLGYKSDKFLVGAGSKPQDFLADFATGHPFDQAKALVPEWKSADLLFQLTDQELSRESSLFTDDSVQRGLLKSYIFIAIELKGTDYARGKFSGIARQINRLFPMPVMVIFKHGDRLTIAVINRRRNKIDDSKDVLEKATLIRDITFAQPHRGHLDILASLALPNLVHPDKLAITDFDTLHTAWERIFNVQLLNKNFYEELANWFFWAKKHSHFPLYDQKADKYDLFHDLEKAKEHEAKNLIRLLTRTLFVWFIKERGLVPDSFFSPADLKNVVLKSFDPESADTNYYKAVLQNLFFATLNQTHGEREFRKEGQHQNTTTLLRYKERLISPVNFVKALEESIPFLNGGLFECLDRPHPTKKGPQGGKVIIYEDGFSDREDNPVRLPNFLFFGKERTVDLSGDDSFGLVNKRNAKVRGLIHILDSYKFTIVENTPIDQEIALDPELLGQVFENLLASYNPETKTTARKHTGSFYTPRSIVDYMVDESLKAYLKRALVEDAKMKAEDAEVGLELLFAYNEKRFEDLGLPEEAKHSLINAIDNCKILDPACGSGAFPMGALQKLVYVLSKLDPGDKLWEKRQLAKVDKMIEAAHEIDDTTFRERAIADAQAQKNDIEEAFSKNELGYGRKLYLIENCLYGVDIQSIATQVTKLRFFISLIVDQKVDRQRLNFGVRPLPNLETKFVTANTLIQLEDAGRQIQLSETPRIKELKNKLKEVRRRIFAVKTPKTKEKYRADEEFLWAEIKSELVDNGWPESGADLLTSWKPYDQNASAPYFDPEWMFGLKFFDIVIGNPPYFKENDDKHRFDGLRDLPCYQGKMDVWYLFVDLGLGFLKENGVLSFIATNNWVTNAGASKLRNKILKEAVLVSLIDFQDYMIFESASIQTMVMLLVKAGAPARYRSVISKAKSSFVREDVANLQSGSRSESGNLKTFTVEIDREELLHKPLLFNSEDKSSILDTIDATGGMRLLNSEIAQGIVPNPDRVNSRNIKTLGERVAQQRGIQVGDGVFVLDKAEKSAIKAAEFKYLKPLYEPTHIEKYSRRPTDLQIIYAKKGYFDPEEAPSIVGHLRRFKEIMEARRENQTGQIQFYNLHWPRDESFFKKGEKLLVPRKCSEPIFYHTEDPAYVMLSMNVIRTLRMNMRFLSAVLNSSVVRYWLRYRGNMQGLNFQIDAAPLLRIPIPKEPASKQSMFGSIVALIQFGHLEGESSSIAAAGFLEDLIDACVMESYFREHMAERDLLFHDTVAPHLAAYAPEASAAEQRDFLTHLHRTLNAPSHTIRNRLLRLTADSPDLLAVIKQEGRV
jgi:adenine-specific DNA-methyltransferase